LHNVMNNNKAHTQLNNSLNIKLRSIIIHDKIMYTLGITLSKIIIIINLQVIQ